MLNARQRLEWDMLHRELECARAHLSPKTAPDWVNREESSEGYCCIHARVFVNAVRYIRMRLRDTPRPGEEWPWDSWGSWAYNPEIEDPEEEEEEAFLQVFGLVLKESRIHRERTEDLASDDLPSIARQIWKAARAYKRTRFPTRSPGFPFEMMLQITVSTALRLHLDSDRDPADTMTALAFTVVTRIKEEDEETILLRAIRKPPWRNPQVKIYTNLDVIVSDLEAAVSDRVDDISFRIKKGNATCNRGRNIYLNGHAPVKKRLGADPFEMHFVK